MPASIPILRCLLLAYPRSLLADYCSLSLLAADFSLLAGLYSLHAAHCHTYAKSGKKKGRPTRQLKILKKSKKQKSRPNVGNYKKKKVSFNQKKSIFYEKKSRSFVGKFKKIKENGL